MSISRKRVGSVSQRNDSPLPPLDIQSIQMPSNPQNALALKTAALSSSKSLFKLANDLRKKLRTVEDFAPFLEQPAGAPPLDVVSHMCHVFRLGSSLCHLYNQLIPSFTNPKSPLCVDLPSPPAILYDFPPFIESPDGVRNWAKKPENEKSCKKYILNFCSAMAKRKEEGRWPGDLWNVTVLWGRSKGDDLECEGYDSSNLMMVFQTVENMLDQLPDSCMTPISPTPPTPWGSSSLSLGSAIQPMTSMNGNNRSSYELSTASSVTLVNGVHSSISTLNDTLAKAGPGPSTLEQLQSPVDGYDNAYKTVEELVNSERSYVQELEILERCSNEILAAQLVSTDTIYSIFSNLRGILDFQRKFLIKLETEYEPMEDFGPQAWTEGRWGRPFVEMEREFECYGPYCANYMDAIKVVNEHMVNLMMGQDLPEGQRPCLHPERELQAFMIKPIQRITKYGLLLEAISRATAKHDGPYHQELQDGIAAVHRIAEDINETTAYKAKLATVRDLVERVDDWKGHDYEKFGDLHLDDQFTVSKADSPRDYHVFLFQKMMLCCKEIHPEKKAKTGKNSNMLRKDKTQSKSQAPAKPRLALKGRIFVSNITAATLIPPPGDLPYAAPRVQIVWSVPAKAGEMEQDVEDSFIMSGRSEDQMKKWAEKVMELATSARKEAGEREAEQPYPTFGIAPQDPRPYWAQSSFAPPTPGAEHTTFFPPQNGLTYMEDDEDLPPSDDLNGLAIYGVPGVPFPGAANRRAQSQQSLPAAAQAELRTRAMTEDQNGPSMMQWRQQQPPLPTLPRITSGASVAASDASWGHQAAHGRRHPSQSSRFDDDYNGPPGAYARYEQHSGRGVPRVTSGGGPNGVPNGYPGVPRTRSASSPNVQPHTMNPLPPLPSSVSYGNVPYPSGSATSSSSSGLGSAPGGTTYFTRRLSTGKRSSQESETTETSETSSQSPRTPHTNAASGDLRGATPVSRSNSQDAPPTSTVYVRVKSGESNFVIGITSDVSYQTLHDKVVKKLRLCSARVKDPLDVAVKIKWLDSDGDEVAIKTDADVQIMLLEASQGQIQLIAA